MTLFLTTAALMLGLALLFVLPVLLRGGPAPAARGEALDAREALNLDVLRDQRRELDADLLAGTLDEANHQSSRRELEQRVAQEVRAGAAQVTAPNAKQPLVAATLAVSITGLAVLLYAAVGTPLALDPARRVATASPAAEGVAEQATVGPAQIEAMVNRLAERLKANPNDPKGWRMLATSYETLRRFDLAAQAYENLLKVTPETPELLADYAVTLGMSRDQTLSGEPEKLINRALVLDPNNIQALALSGSAAYERHDYAAAVGPWKHLLSLVPADSDMARSIAANIAKAEGLAQRKRSGAPDGL